MNNKLETGVRNIQEALKNIPSGAGVYKFANAGGEVLYVGKAKSLNKRIISYTQGTRLSARLVRMVSEVAMVDVVTTESEAAALLLEATLVRKLQPRFNILLKDDKSFPYLFISSETQFPRILKYRGNRKEKGKYFGPFASAGLVNRTITLIQKAFLLRPCPDTVFENRSRPCLQYQIKRCSGPCVRLVSEEEYAAQVKQAVDYLSGRSREIQDELKEKMLEASSKMDFELAAKYRDRINALTQLQGQHKLCASGIEDADIIALHKEGAKACVQVFFFRAGQNFGNRPFFPTSAEDNSNQEIISAFVGTFYQTAPIPREVILQNFMEEEAEIISEALSMEAGYKVTVTIPKKGGKLEAVNLAAKNAGEALTRKLLENSSVTRALEEVANVFALESAPERIEVYDNSHIMGTNQVGAMIVATPEGFAKKHYRKFNIRESDKGDDYAMMREVLTRRFAKLEEDGGANATTSEQSERSLRGARGAKPLSAKYKQTKPDLVLIDGGAGQLKVALEVLTNLGINDVPLVSIAKGVERNAGNETFFMDGKEPFKLPPNSPALFYLQKIRDEAHRFAIGSHRTKRAKSTDSSGLDEISGIGKKRRLAIIRHFGSMKAARTATVKELMQVEGISRKVAETIYSYFHS